MSSDVKGPHIYIVGEVEEPMGPVKIGMVYANGSASGRSGLNAGNWRQLEVLHRQPLPKEVVRWHEYVIHRHLKPFEIRGEWFDVRGLRRRGESWAAFLDRAFRQEVRGGDAVDLGSDEHRLDAIRVLAHRAPRRFVADCSCGFRLRASQTTLPAVYRRFWIEHVREDR
jgi:hypothetical protein